MTTLNKTWSIPPTTRTHCESGLHEWTEENTYFTSQKKRRCKLCANTRNAESYARKAQEPPRNAPQSQEQVLLTKEQAEQAKQEEIASALQSAYLASLRRCHTCKQLRPPKSFEDGEGGRMLIVCHVCRYEVSYDYFPTLAKNPVESRGYVTTCEHGRKAGSCSQCRTMEEVKPNGN